MLGYPTIDAQTGAPIKVKADYLLLIMPGAEAQLGMVMLGTRVI